MAANSNDDPQSEFFLAAQEFARALGVDVEVLLAQYLQEATDTAAADPDCLKSTEIQLFLQDGVLAADRIAHIENCMACTAMAETIVPEGSILRTTFPAPSFRPKRGCSGTRAPGCSPACRSTGALFFRASRDGFRMSLSSTTSTCRSKAVKFAHCSGQKVRARRSSCA